jgi:hypothetical protein
MGYKGSPPPYKYVMSTFLCLCLNADVLTVGNFYVDEMAVGDLDCDEMT